MVTFWADIKGPMLVISKKIYGFYVCTFKVKYIFKEKIETFVLIFLVNVLSLIFFVISCHLP